MLNNWISSTMPCNNLESFLQMTWGTAISSLFWAQVEMYPLYAAVTIISNSCENWNLFLRTIWDNLANPIPELLARKTKGLRNNVYVMGLFHVFYINICSYSQTSDIFLSFGKTISGNLGADLQVLFHMGFLCCLAAQKIRYSTGCSRNEAPQTGCLL